MSATLHYIFDPLCGWCYGAEPLAKAAANLPGIELSLHGGGLWPEPTVLPDHMRSYINEADGRLSEMSGQPLGRKYREELLFDPELVLDSKPTTQAVLAAEQLAGKGLAMLQAIQHAHYVDGMHVVRLNVLTELATGLDLDADEFVAAFEAADADAHIAETRGLMQRIGAQGFPTFVLEAGGKWFGVDHNQFQRDAAGFAQWLETAARDGQA